MLNPALYSSIYLYGIILLSFFTAITLSRKGYIQLQKNSHTTIFATVLCLILIFFLGQRPASFLFGDSYLYRHVFNLYKTGAFATTEDAAEWLWAKITYFCAQNYDTSTYLTIIEAGYFGLALLACYKLTPQSTLVTFLFFLGAFSTYTYGVNGIRNGLACSITLCAIAFLSTSHKYLPLAIVLSIAAMGIHRSTLLPVAALFASTYFVRSFKTAYYFWIASIFISLVAGGAVTALFGSLGFDDRFSHYAMGSIDAGKFSHTGFRWDFLIYSMMPIVLGYYTVIKRGIYDRTYLILLNTYTLANAFWVMVIRANYSNRFAYLSWFMYPVVLAYPLLKLDIWGPEQGKRLAQIMLAQVAFTWIMGLI